MKRSRWRHCLAGLILLALLAGCSSEAESHLADGYYSARMNGMDGYGWQEYVLVCIREERIVSVEYNAINKSGFIKSWDMDYMREMERTDGTYPNEYVRIYSQTLLSRQDPAKVDAISGATHSHQTFCRLIEAALAQAERGDTGVALVEHEAFEE